MPPLKRVGDARRCGSDPADVLKITGTHRHEGWRHCSVTCRNPHSSYTLADVHLVLRRIPRTNREWLTRRQLREWFLRSLAIVAAANGRQGLERLAEKSHPDLVLLDMMMPV